MPHCTVYTDHREWIKLRFHVVGNWERGRAVGGRVYSLSYTQEILGRGPVDSIYM
jgi:hypothetical protein